MESPLGQGGVGDLDPICQCDRWPWAVKVYVLALAPACVRHVLKQLKAY